MRWVVLPIACLMAGPASAAVVFDLRASTGTPEYGLHESFELTEGGLSATVSGRYFTGFKLSNLTDKGDQTYTMTGLSFSAEPSNPYPKVGRWSGGAGVVNSPRDNSHTVDGSGYDDFIQIVFSKPVKLRGAQFRYWDGDDNYRVMYDTNGGTLGNGDIITFKKNNNPFEGLADITSTVFGFAATDGSCKCGTDDWKLEMVSVEPVPLPAAIWLFGSALMGAGVIGRRKKTR